MNRADTQPLIVIEQALTNFVRRTTLPLLRERLAVRAGVRVDASGYVILNSLTSDGQMRPSDLADQIGVDISTISRQVDRLAAEGYVRRDTSPNDGRAVLLSITDSGAQAVQKLRASRRDAFREILRDWDEADIARLAGLLERFTDDLIDFAEIS